MIKELWVYPVKGCRGVRVKSARVVSSGLEFDRAWCIVDCAGEAVSQLEACSKRKLPILATIEVAFAADGLSLLLRAPGMPELAVPTSLEAYASQHVLRVQCSGKSTTADSGGGWWLGELDCKAFAPAGDWLDAYLNRDLGAGKLLSGKKKTTYALARSLERGLEMTSYPVIFPLVQHGQGDGRFAGNERRFADFAPILLVSEASAAFVAERMGGQDKQPIGSFRGNIVVDAGKPWDEETWDCLEVVSSDGRRLPLRQIKPCARCTVPCRSESTGEFLFPPPDTLKLWKVLKEAFPAKFADPEWGSWAGGFFGVYFGHGGREGFVLRVGDVVEVTRRKRWDAHLRRSWPLALATAALAAAALAVLAARRRSAAAVR